MEKETNITTWNGRAIMLLDLDAFFASVEQLDHPNWRGKPVIVGGSADRRGVVSTCSYEARAYGVRSAMPASTARKLCPNAIWTSGNYHRYREISSAVMDIMKEASPFIQQVSIDEAFLDITPSKFNPKEPVAVATHIQNEVLKLGISASIGLGVSKAVAKIASDMDKPQGLTVVYPGREKEFLSPLPVKTLSGIGPVATKKLSLLGIHTLGELASADEAVLVSVFGKNARMMRERSMGTDTDPVVSDEDVKSISHEISFASDLLVRKDIEAAIATVCAKVARRLRMKNLYASSIVLKVRYADLHIKTITASLDSPTDSEYDFIDKMTVLLDEVWIEGIPIRLIGAAAIHLTDNQVSQLSLFNHEETNDTNTQQLKAQRHLQATTDAIRDRFGESALKYGREMNTTNNLTGSSSKNPADYK